MHIVVRSSSYIIMRSNAHQYHKVGLIAWRLPVWPKKTNLPVSKARANSRSLSKVLLDLLSDTIDLTLYLPDPTKRKTAVHLR
jgi:hypothetical protein